MTTEEFFQSEVIVMAFFEFAAAKFCTNCKGQIHAGWITGGKGGVMQLDDKPSVACLDCEQWMRERFKPAEQWDAPILRKAGS